MQHFFLDLVFETELDNKAMTLNAGWAKFTERYLFCMKGGQKFLVPKKKLGRPKKVFLFALRCFGARRCQKGGTLKG